MAEALSHAVIGVQVIADSGTRPHFGVRLVMQAGARRRTVMKLKAAKDLRCLPSGPRSRDEYATPAQIEPNIEALNDAYGDWISAVEKQAIQFLAVSPTAGADYCGPALGHSVVARCVLGLPGSGGSTESHGCRRWRLISSCLSAISSLLRAGALIGSDPRPSLQ